MSLNYFLSCKRNYVKIIQKLEYIIETLDDLRYNSLCEFPENCDDILVQPNDKIFFNDKIKHFNDLIKICNEHLDQLCCHNYVYHTVDTDLERSQTITYCTICETIQN